jgi:hypothetical protein
VKGHAVIPSTHSSNRSPWRMWTSRNPSVRLRERRGTGRHPAVRVPHRSWISWLEAGSGP